MKLFGVEVKHPSPRELGLATFIILMFLAFNLFTATINDDVLDNLFPNLAALSAGVIAASFGISPAKGWRACALLFVISIISYTIVRLLIGQPLMN